MDDDPECLFCKIVHGEVPSKKVFESDEVYAFEDVAPQAPHHLLVIPRRHIRSLNEARPEDGEILGKLLTAAAEIARERGIARDGYRCVVNTEAGAGQSVFHVHLHILAGRPLGWPPG